MLDVAFEVIHSATDAELAYSDLEIIRSLSAPVVRCHFMQFITGTKWATTDIYISVTCFNRDASQPSNKRDSSLKNQNSVKQ